MFRWRAGELLAIMWTSRRGRTSNAYSIERVFPYGRGQGVAINNRDYDRRQPGKPSYRVPDLRIGDPPAGDALIGEVKINNLTIDWTIQMKQPGDSQIQGFFNGASKPKGVVIVIPSQRYAPGAYYIPSAVSLKGN